MQAPCGMSHIDIRRLNREAYFYHIINEDRETILHGKLIKELLAQAFADII